MFKGSPPPVEHEELSLIREEGTDSPILTPLPECDQFSSEVCYKYSYNCIYRIYATVYY